MDASLLDLNATIYKDNKFKFVVRKLENPHLPRHYYFLTCRDLQAPIIAGTSSNALLDKNKMLRFGSASGNAVGSDERLHPGKSNLVMAVRSRISVGALRRDSRFRTSG